MSLYLSIIAVASLLEFRLPASANDRNNDHCAGIIDDRLIRATAIAFFVLALANLASGTSNYFWTQYKYATAEAFVQESWIVRLVLILIGISIILAAIVLIVQDLCA